MKTITYRGEQYEVEDWVNFVAMDADGDIYGYEHEPKINQYGQWELPSGDNYYLGNVGPYWSESLEKV